MEPRGLVMRNHLQTRDYDLSVEAVREIYCPHQLSLGRRAAGLDTRLCVTGAKDWPVVQLRYGAEVKVDAGDFRDLFLVMRGGSGSARVRQGGVESAWGAGRTVVVSANQSTAFQFDAAFSQTSLRLDRERLESLCSRWLGRPLDDDLRFDLAPFPVHLEATWSALLQLVERGTDALPAPAAASLEEFVLTTLLRGVPHNFSAELERPQGRPPSRLIRRAEEYVNESLAAGQPGDADLSISKIAGHLGVGVRTLEIAFQEWCGMTPSAYLRELRLKRVREFLKKAGEGDSVTDIALANGFFHLGRFARYYRERFGESPSATLMNAQRARRGGCR